MKYFAGTCFIRYRRIEAKNSVAVRGCGCYYHPGARVNVVNVI